MSTQNQLPPITQFHPSFLSKYDNIVFDMDGVIWHAHNFLPGVVETLNSLQTTHNKKIFFCTNNSTQHRGSYQPHFKKAGLDVPNNILYTSASTAASHVFYNIFDGKVPEKKGECNENTPKVLVIGQPGLQQEFKDYGLGDNVVTLNDLRNDHTTTLHSLKNFVVDPNIKAVVSGLQTDFAWTDSAIAVMIIRENNTPFIATNRDVTFPVSSTRQLPGAGSVINMIEGSCGKKAQTMGKPEKYMLEAIAKEHPGFTPSRSLFIGDRLDTDIAFGNRYGMDTMLVMSGVTNRDEYFNAVDGIVIPSEFQQQLQQESQPQESLPIDSLPTTDNITSPISPSDIKSPLPVIDMRDENGPRPTYIANNINDLLHVGALLM